MGDLNTTTRSALLRLYNGYTIHKRSFEALVARGYAELLNGLEQQITDAGRAALDLSPTYFSGLEPSAD